MNSKSVKPLLSIDQAKDLLMNFSDWHYTKENIDPPYGFETLVDMYLSEKLKEYARKDGDGKSQSLKPLLSAEEMLNAAHSLFDRYKTKVLIGDDYFLVMDRICFISAVNEYASQLHPSSPQLEQEVKRLQEENEGLSMSIGNTMDLWRNTKADKDYWQSECGRAIKELNELQSRIKELEQQLSQSDAVRFGQYLLKNFKTQYEDEVSADCWMDKRPPFRTMATEFAYALFLAKGNHPH